MDAKRLNNNLIFKKVFFIFLMLVSLLTLFNVYIKVKADDSSTKLSYLSVINYSGGLNPSFSSNVLNYDIEIASYEIDLSFDYVKEDDDATVKIENNKYLKNNTGTINVVVTKTGIPSTTYTINYTKVQVDRYYNFDYTGGEQQFNVPISNKYKLEVWGAQGGDAISYNGVETLTGGYGAYSVGLITLEKNSTLYVNVGGTGVDDYKTSPWSISNGGYNGGGGALGIISSNQVYNVSSGAGGGATHIASVSGVLSSLSTNKTKVIIVAGGGGGSTSHRYNDSSNHWRGQGGHGGGYESTRGISYGRSTIATAATQSAAGCGYDSSSSNGCGTFGKGQSGAYNTAETGGAGGGYFGGGASQYSSASGGSGYIAATNLVSSSEIEKHMTCFMCNTSTALSTKTYSTTNRSSEPISDYAKKDNGYARITTIYTNEDNYLSTLNSDNGTLSPSFTPTTTEYTLNLTKYDNTYTLTGTLSDSKASVDGLRVKHEIAPDAEETVNITVTSEDGVVKVYKVTAKRASLSSGEHSSKLNKIEVVNYENDLNQSFYPLITNYNLSIDQSEIYLKINTEAFDPEATVKIEGNEYISSNSGTINIIVTAPSVSATTYKINYTKTSIVKENEFDYTGEEEVFIAPKGGYYKLEVWGASGGYATSYNEVEKLDGGKGGYATGIVKLNANDKLYINVGEKGIDNYFTESLSTSKTSYNGGGSATSGVQTDSIIRNQLSGSGGGATSIAISSGTLSNLENSKDDILIVAGGGGGATSHRYNDAENIWRGSGGSGGGFKSTTGTSYGRSTSPTLATQTSAGCGYDRTSANGCGSFGQGQNSTVSSDVTWGAGAGGGYYGGGVSNFSATSGGSGYIASDKLISYNSETKHMACYNCETSDEEDTKTMTTTNSSETPTSDYAKDGAGYAKITLIEYLSKDNYLSSLNTTYGTLSPSFDPTVSEYRLTMDKYDQSFRLTGTLSDENATVTGLDEINYVDFGETKTTTITVTSESGDIRTYTVKARRENLVSGEHSSKLSKLDVVGYKESLDPDFHSLVYEYDIEVLKNEVWLDFDLDTYDEEAKYIVEGNKYITGDSGTITIRVKAPSVADSVYTINFVKTLDFEKQDFDYTGGYQIYEAPWDLFYTVETWGANGGTARCNGSVCGAGGGGGYASGIIELKKGDKLYIYVGQQGENAVVGRDTRSSYNGGGYGTTDGTDDETAGGGGGATDVRYFNTEPTEDDLVWNSVRGLGSRIMVAGGAGGANWRATSGFGGGLTGGNGSATAGTQVSGYAFGQGQNAVGRGGSSSTGSAGAGGGYYGGYAVNSGGPASGGSGYVSGFLGSVAIRSDIDLTPRIDSKGIKCTADSAKKDAKCSEHYSELVFRDAKLIGGNSVMPTIDGTGTMVGKSGNGYAKVTPTFLDKDNYLINITTSVGELSPSFDPIIEEYTVNLGVDDTNIELRARPSSDNAKIEGLGEFEVPAGETTFEITVTAESGDVRTYKVTTVREASSESRAENITITGLVSSICDGHPGYCVQDPVFNEETDYYTLTVPSGIREIEFTVDKKHYFENVVGDGVTRLQAGDNFITIEITSEDGENMSLYTYEIYRDTSDDNYIDKLTIKGIDKDDVVQDEEIDIGFNFLITEYAFKVKNNIVKLDLDIVLDDPIYAEVVDIRGNEDFKVGNNVVEIDVKASNNEIRTYILNVYRVSNDNALLSSLKVMDLDDNEYSINPVFRDITTNYTLTVENDVEKVKVEALAQEETTTVTGTGEINLRVGINEIKVISTAESGTIEIYRIIVTRKKNSNNYLSNLEVSYGPFNEIFDKENSDYTITVEPHTKSLDITATPEVSTSTVSILNNNNFVIGENLVTIRVTAQNGDIRDYHILVTKEGSDNDYLKTIDISAGELSPEFNKEVLNYTINVGKDVTSININGIPEDSLTVVQGNGRYNLIAGTNEVILTVVSETGNIRYYLLTIIRAKSENNYLNAIDLSEGSLSPDFNKETLNYTVNVGNEVDIIILYPTLEDARSTLTGDGPKNLVVGENVFPIVVTAENGDVRTYTVTVIRDKSNSANLKKLIIKEGALSPRFDKMKVNYEVTVPFEVTDLSIIAEAEDDDATVSINKPSPLSLGENTVTITVTSVDNVEKVYTIKVTREEVSSFGLNLRSLDVTSCSLEFSGNIQFYECSVAYEVDKTVVTGIPENDENEVIGNGEYDLEVGENLIVVTVKDSDNKTKDYQVLITRRKSTESRLNNIIITNGVMEENFHEDTLEYHVTTKDTSLIMDFVKKHEDQLIDIIGNNGFTLGENTVIIRVTSSDREHTTEYKLIINKEKNDNAYLRHLQVIGHEISPEFNKGITNYSVVVENDEVSVIINAVADVGTSTVTGDGMHSVNVYDNTIIVTVTAEDGTTKNYVINVYRKPSSNNYLYSLEVDDGTLSPEFNKMTTNYTVRVPYEKNRILISGIPEDPTSTISGLGEMDLVKGNNKFYIFITAQNGNVRTYVLNVIRENPITSLLENIEVRNYLLEPTFNSETLEYNVVVDNEITSLDLIITKLDPNSTYVINGNQDFEVGLNRVEVVSTSSDGVETTTYVLYVNRQAYSNTYLSTLTVSEGILTPSFDKTNLSYTVEVESNIDEIEIKATPENPQATVNGTGVKTLNTGDNLFKITVTSPTNVVRTYLVNIIKRSSNANIRRIETNIGTITRLSDDSFKLVVLKDVEKITKDDLNIILEDPRATISMVDEIVLNETKYYYISVTSEDGNITKEYVIEVEYLLSNDYYLSKLIPSIGTLSPAFKKTTNNYTIEVSEDATEIDFEVALNNEFATLLTSETLTELNDYTTIKEFLVQAENGEVNTYKITINKSITRHKTLDNIEITGVKDKCEDCELPEYNETTYEYNITVPYIIDDIGFRITKKHQSQIVKIYKNDAEVSSYKLDVGLNTFVIKVKNSYDEELTYTYNITRLKNDNNYLASLKLTLPEIELEDFDKEVLEYDVTVPYSYEDIEIEAIPEDTEHATVKINGVRYLLDGLINDVSIKVTAMDGQVREYIIHVLRMPKTNNLLKTLTVSSGDIYILNPRFKSGIMDYTLEVGSVVEKIQIDALPDDENATVDGNGEYDLKIGLNKIPIKVTSVEGDERTYTVNITRRSDRNVYLERLNILNGSIEPTFDKKKGVYDVFIANQYSSLNLDYAPEDPKAKVEVKGNSDLVFGENLVYIKVTASDGSASKTYTLVVYKEGEDKKDLLDIKVNGESIPGFDRTITDYNLEVDNIVDSALIDVVRESEYEVISGLGTHSLESGKTNKIEIEVTAQNGSKKTYKVNIYRKRNNYLSDIVTDKGTLAPPFDKTNFDYKIEVDNEVKDITIIGVKEDADAVVTGNGTYTLNVGDNIVIIGVTNEEDTRNYKVNIVREGSHNTYLSYLDVAGGIVEPEFDKETLEYDVTVPNDVKVLSLDYKTEDDTSEVEIIGNYSDEKTNTVILKVTSTGGDTREYKLNVTREDESYFSNKLLNLTVSKGTLSPRFDTDVLSYTVTVSQSVNKITINVVKESPLASVEGIGDQRLAIGRNVFPITVTSKDGKKRIYTVIVYRKNTSDARLEELEFEQGSLSPTFNKNVYDYVINISNDEMFLDITKIKPVEEDATYQIKDSLILFENTDNQVRIEVTAGDNVTKKTYTVKIVKSKSSNNYLRSLSTSVGSLNPVFNRDTNIYTVYVDENVNSINVAGVPESNLASVSGMGLYNLRSGNNYANVSVTAENGEVRVYTIKIVKGSNNNANLKSLGVRGYEISPSFDKDTSNYTLEVENDIEEVIITAEPEAVNSTVSGIGLKELKVGNNVYPVTVTAESGNTKIYELTIKRKATVSTKIKDLWVEEGILSPLFSSETKEYTILIPNEYTSITEHVTLEDELGSYVINGNNNFKVGENKVQIVVTSSENETDTYVLNVIRQQAANTYLKTLVTNKGTLTPSFDKTNQVYEIHLSSEINNITIIGTPEANTSTVEGSGEYTLEKGDNLIVLTVKSQSNITRSYQVRVIREKSNNNYLSLLEVNGYNLVPAFNKNTLDYEVTTSVGEDEVEILAVAESELAYVSGDGNYDIILGEQMINVIVTAEDGSTKTYNIKVIRPADNNLEIESISPSTGSLSPEFDDSISDYKLNVSPSTNVVDIDVIPKSVLTKVSGNNDIILDSDTKEVTITLTAENGSTRDVVISIQKEAEYTYIDTDNVINIIIGEEIEIDIKNGVPADELLLSVEENLVTIDGLKITGAIEGRTILNLKLKNKPSVEKKVVVNVYSDLIKSSVYDVLTKEKARIVRYKNAESRTTINSFLENIENDLSTVRIYDKDDNLIEDYDEIVATGMKITIEKGSKKYDEAKIIVMGDVDGDGLINVTDTSILQNHIVGIETIDDYRLYAMDLSLDDLINVTDQVEHINYLISH